MVSAVMAVDRGAVRRGDKVFPSKVPSLLTSPWTIRSPWRGYDHSDASDLV